MAAALEGGRPLQGKDRARDENEDDDGETEFGSRFLLDALSEKKVRLEETLSKILHKSLNRSTKADVAAILSCSAEVFFVIKTWNKGKWFVPSRTNSVPASS